MPGTLAAQEDVAVDRFISEVGEFPKRGLRLAIRKQAGANTVEVARRVLEQVEAVNAEFPQIRIVPVIDSACIL